VTGGYYQPVRAIWRGPAGDETGFALQRIICRIGSIAPTDVAGKYATDYVANNNPVLGSAVLDPGGANAPLFTAGQTAPPPATVTTGQVVTLEADWPEGTAEDFLVYDIPSHALVTQHEALRLSWFATGGVFQHDRTGRTESEPETDRFTQNLWTAPLTPGSVHLWLVLRDSRGGVDFAEAQIDVTQ
jgi:hypothetical protein